jgi:PAS domain S-box-containing protein
VNLIGSYNYALVALSVLIAMFASYAALDLAGRVTAAGGWTRAVWLLGGAGAMGTGIWSMHYIGMLAFILPIPVAYHWPTVLLSLFAAILASVIALYVASRQKMGGSRAVAGSVLMGAGIASMHYIGMAAMRLPAICQFNSFLVVLSVVFAVLISLAALWITFHFRDERTGIGWEKLTGAAVMGAAIPVMHYTGMTAASFTPSGMPADLSHAISISALGTAGIAAVTFIVLGLALLTSWVDKRFAAQTLELQEEKLQRSEAYLAEAQRLSHTGSFGWRPSTGEIIWSEETFRIFQYDRTTIPTAELGLQRVHPEDAARVKQIFKRASQDVSDFELEYRLVMPDGAVKHVDVMAHAVNDESGGIEFVGAVMDISERKRAEEELRRSEALGEQRLRLVVDTTPAMLNSCRPDGYLDYVNKGWLDYFGFSLETALDRADVMKMSPPSKADMQGSNWQPVIHPEDLPEFTDHWKSMLVSGKPGEREARVRRYDGVYRWHLFRAVPFCDETGKPVKWYASAFDIEDRKRAEEALRRSESYLAEAQRLTHTASWAWWVAGRDFLHLSEEWYRIYGFDSEKGIPAWEEVLQRIHPRDRAKWQGAIDRAIGEKSDYEMEYRILLPSGTVKYIRTVGHPVLNASGDLVQFVGSATDITERKQAEQALRRSEGYLAEAQRLTRIGSWAWNVATGQSVYWSQENYRLFGFDPEGGIPSDEAFYQRVHPEDRDRVRREVFLERPDEGSHFDVDFRIVVPEGTIKYVRSTGHPVFNASGDLVEYVGTSIDVTERKRVDEERERLLASERAAFAEAVAAQQRFSDLVNSVEGIVWEADVPSFQFSFINKQAERVLGYPVERWLSEPTFWKDHVHPEDQEWTLEYCQTATAEKRDHEFEYRMIAADGSVVWLRDLVTVVMEGDRVTRVRGVMVDLTNRKRAEEALRQAQSDLAHVNRVTTMGELTASLAHEVNQPIAAAVTNANTCLRWLAANPPNVEEARAAATRIAKDGTRAAEIISRIRLLFKKGAPPRELVDVNEVIREMIVLLRSEATRYSVSVRTELAADLPQVLGDPVQLQQVLMNLMINGIDAMEDVDGTRELIIKSQRAENEQLLVSVSDTGAGLPPQQADQIFNAFFTTKQHGTGMGLRISRSLIESHGGRLWAADNSPRGASFCFTLPTKVEADE